MSRDAIDLKQKSPGKPGKTPASIAEKILIYAELAYKFTLLLGRKYKKDQEMFTLRVMKKFRPGETIPEEYGR